MATRHGTAQVTLPTDCEILITRHFEAPVETVWRAVTEPRHVLRWWGPDWCPLVACEIDFRVGGAWRYLSLDTDGNQLGWHGTYLEIEAPTRIVATWLFEGWPDADAVESVDLRETDGVTKLTMTLAFRDKAGRDHMTRSDGQEDSFNKMEDYLRSLLEQKETVSG